jgi:hypothetical protein
MATAQVPVAAESGGDVIVARAGRYYRNTRFMMCALLIGAGAWFAYDGWVAWPEHNRKVVEVNQQILEADRAGDQQAASKARETLGSLSKEHSASDIRLQKALACSLPPLGIALVVWALYNSRGEYRLSGNALSVPGHPSVSIDHIQRIDKRLWDRKGIAFFDYEVPQGAKGRIRLDDFVYERKPTDQIYERIERIVSAEAPTML